jgi:hypothetical protein
VFRRGRARGRGFSTLPEYSDASLHVNALRDIIGTKRVLSSEMDKYTQDWTGNYRGGSAVALPSCSEEVSSLMKYCHAHRIGVVMQGGNTGLVVCHSLT